MNTEYYAVPNTYMTTGFTTIDLNTAPHIEFSSLEDLFNFITENTSLLSTPKEDIILYIPVNEQGRVLYEFYDPLKEEFILNSFNKSRHEAISNIALNLPLYKTYAHLRSVFIASEMYCEEHQTK